MYQMPFQIVSLQFVFIVGEWHNIYALSLMSFFFLISNSLCLPTLSAAFLFFVYFKVSKKGFPFVPVARVARSCCELGVIVIAIRHV